MPTVYIFYTDEDFISFLESLKAASSVEPISLDDLSKSTLHSIFDFLKDFPQLPLRNYLLFRRRHLFLKLSKLRRQQLRIRKLFSEITHITNK